jgi:2-oxo-3-hexenedioate decarboxylase
MTTERESHVDVAAVRALSDEVLVARRERRTIGLPSRRYPSLDEAAAYRVARTSHDALVAEGEQPVGRKIGFTNRGIWDEYEVYRPIWGHVYASTRHVLHDADTVFPRANFCQPRIEPEIMLGFGRAPRTDDLDEIAASLDWIAHGFEIVDCHFADWKFTVVDTIADFALHGALFVGERVPLAGIPDVVAALSGFRIALHRNGQRIDEGRGSNVLDGPIQAVAHLMRVLAAQDLFAPIAAGEVISTGTLTAAWPLSGGERWHTTLDGIALPGATLTIA